MAALHGATVLAGIDWDALSTDVNWAALAPIAVAALAFVVYCLVDLRRSTVRVLPKWAWAVVCVVSIPLGGILYLLVGREHR